MTSTTLVCGVHFVDSDFFPIFVDAECGKSTRRRLKLDAVPSVFSFLFAKSRRPSPLERQCIAAARAAELQRLARLPKLGPLRKH